MLITNALFMGRKAFGGRICSLNTRDKSQSSGPFLQVWLRGTRFATEETIQAGFNQGVFVDILPYDALSRDEKLARKQRRSCRFWQSVSYLYHAKSIVLPHDGVVASIEHLACGFAHVAARALFTHDKIVSSFNRGCNVGKRCRTSA